MKNFSILSIFLFTAFLFTIQIAKAQETPEWAQGANFGMNDPDAFAIHYKDFEVDSDGNTYFVGTFVKSLKGENFEFTAIPNDTYGNSFIIKFDINGNYVWHKQISSNATSIYTNKDETKAIVIDDNDDIYITGHYLYSLDFGNGITLESNIDSYHTMFLAKINSDGITQWAKDVSRGEEENEFVNGYDIIIDQEGDVLCTGSFDHTVSFDGGITEVTSVGGADIFIAKYNSDNGNIISFIQGGGEDSEYALAIITDNDNNYYIFGKFNNSAVFGSTTFYELNPGNGMYDRYIAKWSPDGTFIKAILIASTGFDETDFCHNIKCDNNNNIYFCDEAIADDIYFDENNIIEANYNNTFGCFGIYNSNLEFQWGTIYESENGDANISDFCFDEQENIYITGYFTGEIDLGNGIVLQEAYPYPNNTLFLLKYDTSGDEPLPEWADQVIHDETYGGDTYNGFIDIRNGNYFWTGVQAARDIHIGDVTLNGDHDEYRGKLFIVTDYAEAPIIQSAIVLSDGFTIEATFNKEMTLYQQTAPGGFSIDVQNTDKEDNPIVAFQLKNGEPETIIFYLTNQIMPNNDVFLNYTPGTIQSLDKGELETITNFPVTNNSTVSISEINNNFKIYPNPSNGIFTINSEQLTNNNEQLTITNITGKIIKKFTIHKSQITINLTNQPAGIYFIKIETETDIYTEKLIIQ